VTRIRPGAAALSEVVNPELVIAHARAWIGTPFVRQGALRGSGADCIGLIRGLAAELSGKVVPAPSWREDWSRAADEPILRGLAAQMIRVPVSMICPGNIVTFRVGQMRAAHVGVFTDRGIIHAWEQPGAVCETCGPFRQITSAWAIPCHPNCEGGPGYLTPDDCLAVVYPDPRGAFAEISLMSNGTPLARSRHFKSQSDALAMLAPIYVNIETVE